MQNTTDVPTTAQQRRPSRAPWVISALILLAVAAIAIFYGYSSKPLSSIAQPDGVEQTQAIESQQDR